MEPATSSTGTTLKMLFVEDLSRVVLEILKLFGQ
jgi:hypothetical protein